MKRNANKKSQAKKSQAKKSQAKKTQAKRTRRSFQGHLLENEPKKIKLGKASLKMLGL